MKLFQLPGDKYIRRYGNMYVQWRVARDKQGDSDWMGLH